MPPFWALETDRTGLSRRKRKGDRRGCGFDWMLHPVGGSNNGTNKRIEGGSPTMTIDTIVGATVGHARVRRSETDGAMERKE